MKTFLIFAVVFFFSLAGYSQQTQTQTQTSETSAKVEGKDKHKDKSKGKSDELEALLEEYYAAWNTMDPGNAAGFYAKDPTLVFYDVLPLQYRGWNEYEAGVKQVFTGFASMKVTPNTDIEVTRKGKIVWTTMTFHLSAKAKDGTMLDADGRHTIIWEKRKDKWLIVHEHISAPLPSPPPTSK